MEYDVDHVEFVDRLKYLVVYVSELAFDVKKGLQPIDFYLRSYVSLYLEVHHKSSQFFPLFCEHNFISLMLGKAGKTESQTCLLECLNMILANTKNSESLVYLLSQNCLHSYLFNPDILTKEGDFIEYYVQLLKTILLKISQTSQNKPLIKFFCNSKYPHFPIFTFATILAGDSNELVKVTAQQCVLIVVGMINEQKLYSTYLTQLPMLSFVVKLASDYLLENVDHEGICNYFVDLIFELRANRTPLLLVNNIICSVIIIKNIPNNYERGLNFIWSLGCGLCRRIASMSEDIEQPVIDNLLIMCMTHTRIIAKMLTNKYLNASLVATYEHVKCIAYSSDFFPSFHSQWKIFVDFRGKLYLDENEVHSEHEYDESLMQAISYKILAYGASKQFCAIKNSPDRKKNENGGFLSLFFSKKNDWARDVADLAGLKIEKGRLISFSFPSCIRISTAAFINQYTICVNQISIGQIKLETEDDQISYNQFMHGWGFNTNSLRIIEKMAELFKIFMKNEFKAATEQSLENITVSKIYVPFYFYFLMQIKADLSTNLHRKIEKKPQNDRFVSKFQSIFSLLRIWKILQIRLDENVRHFLTIELSTLHGELQTFVFQAGFKHVMSYIDLKGSLKKKRKLETSQGRSNEKMLSFVHTSSNIFSTGEINKREESLKQRNTAKLSKTAKVLPSTEDQKEPRIDQFMQKLCLFEFIQKVLNPKMKSLRRHFEEQWSSRAFATDESKEPNQVGESSFCSLIKIHEIVHEFQVRYYGKPDCRLAFEKYYNPPAMTLTISLNAKNFIELDIRKIEEIRLNQIDKHFLQIEGSNLETFRVSSPEQACQIIKIFSKYKQALDQAITQAFLEYLQMAHSLIVKRKADKIRLINYHQTPK